MSNHNPPCWGKAEFAVQNADGSSFLITISGRDRWALQCLIAAGAKGCTPLDHPGPRWSADIHDLRARDIRIATVTEAHEGPFKGTHARYVLQSAVSLRAVLLAILEGTA